MHNSKRRRKNKKGILSKLMNLLKTNRLGKKINELQNSTRNK